ncbi:MAG: hypothetical protein ACRDPB_08760, partial [Nocardioidaceae bacterium]
STASAHGITRHRLAVLLAEREVRQVPTGVYVRGDVADTIEVRVHASSLVISEHAVVCDRTAAWVWGVDGVKVTTPLRTALDLACKLRRRDALAALDGFMRSTV